MSHHVACYLRIAPTARGWKFAASQKQPVEPLRSSGYASEPLPTICFKLALSIPHDAWDPPVAVVAIEPRQIRPLVEASEFEEDAT